VAALYHASQMMGKLFPKGAVMKRWIAVVGIGVMVVLALIGLRGFAQYQPAPAVESRVPSLSTVPPAPVYYQPQPVPGQYQAPPAVPVPVQPSPAPAYPSPGPVVAVPQPSSSAKHFLEIGKSYTFVMTNGKSNDLEKCKVAELPRDGWVKVKVKEGNTSIPVWINLSQVAYVIQGGPSGKASASVTSE
jgi:hypothetical protein